MKIKKNKIKNKEKNHLLLFLLRDFFFIDNMSTTVTTIPMVKPNTVLEKKPISYQTLLLGAGKKY